MISVSGDLLLIVVAVLIPFFHIIFLLLAKIPHFEFVSASQAFIASATPPLSPHELNPAAQ